jgi:hypothetical protein
MRDRYVADWRSVEGQSRYRAQQRAGKGRAERGSKKRLKMIEEMPRPNPDG